MCMELRTGDVLCIVSQLFIVTAQLNFDVILQGEVLFWLLMMYILMFLSMDIIFVSPSNSCVEFLTSGVIELGGGSLGR